MGRTNWHLEAENALVSRLNELHEHAYGLVEAHWQLVRANEQKLPGWENKSGLQLRCVRTGKSFRVEWSGIEWRGSKARNTRKALRVHIQKNAEEPGYSLKKLHAHCKEWEKPLVADTEEKLVTIRREVRHITKALQLIRFASDVADHVGDEVPAE
jgi:hypothetical protein